jgi:hypothetical protein
MSIRRIRHLEEPLRLPSIPLNKAALNNKRVFLSYSQLWNSRLRWERGSAQQNSVVPCVQIGCTCAILGGQGEPLGSSVGIYPNQIWQEYIQTHGSVDNHLSGDVELPLYACFKKIAHLGVFSFLLLLLS